MRIINRRPYTNHEDFANFGIVSEVLFSSSISAASKTEVGILKKVSLFLRITRVFQLGKKKKCLWKDYSRRCKEPKSPFDMNKKEGSN